MEHRLASGGWQRTHEYFGNPDVARVTDLKATEQLELHLVGKGLKYKLTSLAGRPLSPVQPQLTTEWQHVLPGLQVRLTEDGGGLSNHPFEYRTWQDQDEGAIVGSAEEGWKGNFLLRGACYEWYELGGVAGRFQVRSVRNQAHDRQPELLEFRCKPELGND